MEKNDKTIWLIVAVIVAILVIAFYLFIRKKKITPADIPACHGEGHEEEAPSPGDPSTWIPNKNYLELIIEPMGTFYYQCNYFVQPNGPINSAGLPIEPTETAQPPLIALQNWFDFGTINQTQLECGIAQYYNLGGT